MRTSRESDDQKALAQLLDTIRIDGRPLLWCHVPNEGKRNIAYAVELQRRGVKAGVPDVLIFDAPPDVPLARGCAIELKRAKDGEITEHQDQWLWDLNTRGWMAIACHGIDAAIQALEDLGYKKAVG